MLKPEKNIFWGIMAVFVLTRIAIFLFFIDTSYNYEETYVGFISTEILSGDLKIPLPDYIMRPRHFSNVLVAILLTPFIFIFGNNLIAVKLFALFIATINLGVWYLLLRNISQRTAFFFSIIYISTPTMFTNIMLISWPPYALIFLLMGAALLLLVKILDFESENCPRTALLGLVCGVGGWIFYVHLLLLPFIFLFWGMKDKLFFLKKQFAVFTVFFLIGMAPWLLYNIQNSFPGFIFSGDMFGGANFSFFQYKLIKIFAVFMPNFFFYRGTHLSTSYVYYFLFILSYIAVIVDLVKNFEMKKLSTPAYAIKFAIVVYPFIYLSIISSAVYNDRDIKAAYIAFMCPFILSIIALGLTYVRPIFQKGFLVMLIFCHLFTYSYRMPYAKFLQGLSYKADSGYGILGDSVISVKNYDYHHFYNMLEKFPYERKQNILMWYLLELYNMKGMHFDGIYFLMGKYGHQFDVFCGVLIMQEPDVLNSNFIDNIQDGVNLCGKVRYGNLGKMELRSESVSEIVSAIESLSDSDKKEVMYFYLGKVVHHYKQKDFYKFYKGIPHPYRYRYVQGRSFTEFEKVNPNYFFRPEHINNFGSIENRIHEILLSVPDDDEECIRDVYAAYIAVSYWMYTVVTQDDYSVIPLNKKIFQNYIASIEDKKMMHYINIRLKEMLKMENGFSAKFL